MAYIKLMFLKKIAQKMGERNLEYLSFLYYTGSNILFGGRLLLIKTVYYKYTEYI